MNQRYLFVSPLPDYINFSIDLEWFRQAELRKIKNRQFGSGLEIFWNSVLILRLKMSHNKEHYPLRVVAKLLEAGDFQYHPKSHISCYMPLYFSRFCHVCISWSKLNRAGWVGCGRNTVFQCANGHKLRYACCFPTVVYDPKTSKLLYLLPVVIFHRTGQTNQTDTPKRSGTMTEVGGVSCNLVNEPTKSMKEAKKVAKQLQPSLEGRH